MTSQQAAALRAIAEIVINAVRVAGPMGAPGGHIYAAMMAGGISLSQYQQIMAGLVRAGKLTKHGECYRVAGGL